MLLGKIGAMNLVFLGIEQEMNRINKSKKELGDYFKKIVINTENVIDITGDKWYTYKFLKENEISVIPSTLQNDYESLVELFNGKFIVKPRCSYSSRGIGIINNKIEFDYYKQMLGNDLMAQRIVGDSEHEYTVASFGFGDGETTNPFILKRRLSFEGSTLKAEVIDDEKIEKSVYRLAKILKPVGPTNYQYRVEGDDVFLLEINPRISSSTSLRTAFGYNEAEIAISFFIKKEKEKFINIKKGKAVRYIADYIEYV